MLHVEVRGRGKPIVFLHGLAGSTRYWGNSFNSLSARNSLVFVDLLGFGKSPKPEVDYSVTTHLDALHDVFVKRKIKNATLVAHSFGTVLAAHYAAKYPEDVQRLVLLGTPVFSSPEDARRHISKVAPVIAFFSFHPRLGRLSCVFHTVFPRLSSKIARSVTPKLQRVVADDSLLHTWTSYSGSLRVLLRHPIVRPLRSVGRKTILIHGTFDRITSVRRMRTLAATTGARLIITHGRHHDYVTTPMVKKVL